MIEEQETESESQDVVEYLRDHPDFFLDHAEVLVELRIPHDSGQAVSLVERQVQVLRNQLSHCQSDLAHLVAVARENESLSGRMHQLTTALVVADTFEELITVLQDELFDHFQADAVEMRLFSSLELEAEGNSAGAALIARLRAFWDSGKPVCGNLDSPQLEFIFGPLAETVASTAIVPIRSDESLGILAIGSRSPDRFVSDKGTLFLTRLAEIINACLRRVSLPGL